MHTLHFRQRGEQHISDIPSFAYRSLLTCALFTALFLFHTLPAYAAVIDPHLMWNDTVIGNNSLATIHSVPLNVVRPAYIDAELTGNTYDVRGELYYLPDLSDLSVREYVTTIKTDTEEFSFAWERAGVYEIDYFEETLTVSQHEPAAPSGLLARFTPVAHAQTPWLVETHRFQIIEASSDPVLTFVATSSGQFRLDGMTPIGPGDRFVGNTAVFKGYVESPIAERVQLEVEITRSGLVTDTSVYTGELVESGTTTSVTVSDLIPPHEHYTKGGSAADIVWRARAVSESGKSSAWMTPINATPAFSIKVVPLVTQVFSQYPPRDDDDDWTDSGFAGLTSTSTLPKGSCGWSIGQCGCAITSLAMIALFNDVRTDVVGAQINPFTINTWFNENGGYVDGNIQWASVDKYFANKLVFDTHQNFYTGNNPPSNFEPSANDFALIDRYVATSTTEFIPVIGFSHWRRARGGSARTHFFVVESKYATGKYTVRDPYWYQTSLLDEQNAVPSLVRRYEGGLEGIRTVLKGSEEAPYIPRMLIQLASPAELLLTDAQGRRLGVDPRTDVSYSEIPGGSYVYEPRVHNPDPNTSDPNYVDSIKTLMLTDSLDGDYSLEVVGTDVGNYTLSYWSIDTVGAIKYDTYAASTSPDAVDRYGVAYRKDDISKTTVSESSFTSLIEELHILIDKIGNPGIRQAIQAHLKSVARDYKADKRSSAIKKIKFLQRFVLPLMSSHIPHTISQKLQQTLQSLLELL